VQTGVGRTGRFLAFHHSAVEADVVALAKALGGGVPIGAMLCKERLANALPPGSHGSTFGGNALATAAALAVLDVLEAEGLIELVESKSRHLVQSLERLAERRRQSVEGVRGRGLLQGLVLEPSVDARQVLSRIREKGVLLTLAGGRALRFSPPLIVSTEQLDEGVAVVDEILGEL